MKLAYPYQGGKPAPYTPRDLRDLASPLVRQAFAVWQAGAPGDSLPPAAGFDILAYTACIGCINLLELREPPLDFVFRVHSATGADVIGRDMTGRSVWDYPDPLYGSFVYEVCRRAKLERRPQVVIEEVLVRRRHTSFDCPYLWEAALMPLAGPGGAVERLVFAFDLQRLG